MKVSELITLLQTMPPEARIVKMFGGTAVDVAHPPIMGSFIAQNSDYTGTTYYRPAIAGSTLVALADEIIQAVVL
jgi:hypothetical protein